MIGDRFTEPGMSPEERAKALEKAKEHDGRTFVTTDDKGNAACPNPGHDYHMAQKAGVPYAGPDVQAQLDTLLANPAAVAALKSKLGLK